MTGSFTAGLIQVVNMDDLTGQALRLLNPFILFFDSASIINFQLMVVPPCIRYSKVMRNFVGDVI